MLESERGGEEVEERHTAHTALVRLDQGPGVKADPAVITAEAGGQSRCVWFVSGQPV